jgi:hypothetical protein
MKLSKSIICIYIFIITLTLYSSICFAEDWVFVTFAKDLKIYVDIDSIDFQREKKQVKCLTKAIFDDGSYVVAKEVFSIMDNTYKTISITQYDRNGKIIKTVPGDKTVKRRTPDKASDDIFKEIIKHIN